jgi:predicted cupin superfamily sugar epimerase
MTPSPKRSNAPRKPDVLLFDNVELLDKKPRPVHMPSPVESSKPARSNLAQQIIAELGLQPHPIEGGFFLETHRSPAILPAAALPNRYQSLTHRSVSTAIYYLLTAETFSEMHRLPTEEVFHLYLGGPVRMLQLFENGQGQEFVIGSDILAGQRPQWVVPAGVWQGTHLEPGVDFALLGATVAPGFDFADYEQASRAQLISQYPNFAQAIHRLTRVD